MVIYQFQNIQIIVSTASSHAVGMVLEESDTKYIERRLHNV